MGTRGPGWTEIQTASPPGEYYASLCDEIVNLIQEFEIRGCGGNPSDGGDPPSRRAAQAGLGPDPPTGLDVAQREERNVTELCADLGTQSQPAVSHHLALLRHGRLIEPRRSGKHNFYALTEAGRELAHVVNSVVS